MPRLDLLIIYTRSLKHLLHSAWPRKTWPHIIFFRPANYTDKGLATTKGTKDCKDKFSCVESQNFGLSWTVVCFLDFCQDACCHIILLDCTCNATHCLSRLLLRGWFLQYKRLLIHVLLDVTSAAPASRACLGVLRLKLLVLHCLATLPLHCFTSRVQDKEAQSEIVPSPVYHSLSPMVTWWMAGCG